MKIFLRVTLLASVALLAMAADPALVNLIMPGAKVVSGLDVRSAKASPFGQLLLRQMQKDEKSFQELLAATGFDPRRDLHELLFAAADPQVKGSGLVLASGNFDTVRIISALRMQNAMVSTYRGAELIRPQAKPGASGVLALVGGTLALAGEEMTVKAALDRRAGAAPQVDAGTAAKIQSLSARYDAWFFSTAPTVSMFGNLPKPPVGGGEKPEFNAIQGIQQTSGGVKLGSDIVLSGEALTRSPQDATAVMNIIQFLAGMIQMNREKPGASELAEIANTLKVEAKGNTVTLSLLVTSAQAEQWFQQLQQPKTQRKKASL